MVKYPQQVLDSLQEYSERYKLDSKEYKNFIDSISKLPNQVLNKAIIYNKGKTNLEKGSIVIMKVPTTRGITTRAYVVLSGVPILIDKKNKIPILDLHSMIIQRENPIDSIKEITTSDNKTENDTITQNLFFITEDFLTRRKEAVEKVETIEEPKKLPRKRTTTPKKAKEKTPKESDILEIPSPKEEEKAKKEKILETAKRIKKDKEKEKEEEEIKRLEDAYTKIKFSCLNAVHNMGYTKKESEEICDGFEDLIQEHAHSAVEKKTPSAIEEYAKLFADKIVPARVKKPSNRPKEKKETTKKVDRSQIDLESLLMAACFWLSSHYSESTEESYTLCEERKEYISEITSEMMANKIDLIQAMRQLEMTFVEGESHPLVHKKKISQRELLKLQVNTIMTDLIANKLGLKTMVKEEQTTIHNIERGFCIYCKSGVDQEVHAIVAEAMGTTGSKLYNANRPSKESGYDYERCFDLVFDYKAKAYTASGGRITPSKLINELESKINSKDIKIIISDVPIL